MELFLKYNAWLMFYLDNVTTIFGASCDTFQYEKFIVKI